MLVLRNCDGRVRQRSSTRNVISDDGSGMCRFSYDTQVTQESKAAIGQEWTFAPIDAIGEPCQTVPPKEYAMPSTFAASVRTAPSYPQNAFIHEPDQVKKTRR